MSVHKVECPFCQSELLLSEEYIDKLMKCPVCKNEICFSNEDIPDFAEQKTIAKASLPPPTVKTVSNVNNQTVEKKSNPDKNALLTCITSILIFIALVVFCFVFLDQNQKQNKNLSAIIKIAQDQERMLYNLDQKQNKNLSAIIKIAQDQECMLYNLEKNITAPVYEYKVLTINAEQISSRAVLMSSATLQQTLGKYPDWEFVDAVTEVETEHPNFGDSRYVTGIQPDVRTCSITLILRKKIIKK